MTALELVERLLDEAESPKKVLRSISGSPKRIPKFNEVTFELEAIPENEDPRGHFDDPQDVEFVRQQIENGNVWGWCSTHVTAKWADQEGNEYDGEDYLGGCSYHSRRDFMQPGGYYDDMKASAYDQLVAKLRKAGFH